MTVAIIAGAAVFLSATYVFEIRPALDEREIHREMTCREPDTRTA